ncbi:MAG: phosphoribosylanthranilate isomerase [Planctomycetota bacterium]
MRIKICGVKCPADVFVATQAGATAVGINLVPESLRWIGGVNAAHRLIMDSKATDKLLWAGVFVNPDLVELVRITTILRLQIVQLHGEETPDFVLALKRRLPKNVAIWKAMRVASADDLEPLKTYQCDAWLVDAKVAGTRGGSGKTFDWSILQRMQRSVPLVLSGGLNPTNVAQAIHVVAPDWVDVASGVESTPGVKDAALIAAFVRAATLRNTTRWAERAVPRQSSSNGR